MKLKFYITIILVAIFGHPSTAQQNIFTYCKNTPLHFGKGFLINNPWQGSFDLFQSFQTDSTNQAGSAQISYTIVQNSAQLRTSLNQNNYLSVSYLGNSLNASYGVSSNSYSSSSSITYALTGTIDYGTVNLKNPILTSAAQNDTSAHKWTGFVTRFGDNYIDQISLGVSFTVFITLNTVSSSLQNQVNASIAVNGGYGPLTGSAASSFSSAVRSASSSSNLTIQIVSNGADISSLSNLVQTACTYTNSIDSITSAITTCMKAFNIRNSLITAFHYTPMSTLGIKVTNTLFQAAKINKLMKLFDHYYDVESKISQLNSIVNSPYYKDFHNTSDEIEAARLLQQYNSASNVLANAHNACVANPCIDLNSCCNDPVFNFNDALIRKFTILPFSDCIASNPKWSKNYANNSFTFTNTSDCSLLAYPQDFYFCSNSHPFLAKKKANIKINGTVFYPGTGFTCLPATTGWFFNLKLRVTTSKADSTVDFVPSSTNQYGTTNAATVPFMLSTSDTIGQDGSITTQFQALTLGVYSGCTSELILKQGASIVISVPDLTPDLSAIISPSDTSICQGGSITLNANLGTGLAYQWQLNGINIPGAVNSSYVTSIAGNYTVVIVESASGKSSTSYWATVKVNQSPSIPTISGSHSFCQGSSDTLTANSSGCVNCTYIWSPTNQTGQVMIAKSAGTYTVTVSNGCSPNATSQPFVISLNQSPLVSLSVQQNYLIANNISGAIYQWFFNGNKISGATNYIHIYDTTGFYHVQITDMNGCSGESKDTFLLKFGGRGIDGNSVSNLIDIYPNPANNVIFIQSTLFESKEFFTISVADILGEIVLQKIETGEKSFIDIRDLRPGLYLMEIKSAKYNIVKRFIKE